MNEIAAKYQLSPVMISRWKNEFLDRAQEQQRVADLERKIGQLTYEVDCLKKIPIIERDRSSSSKDMRLQ